MRLIKYVFLLLILMLFASTVFIATQKGTYEVERSIIIKSSQQAVFNYLADYRNWDQWVPWQDASMKTKYPQKTQGIGSYYMWSSDTGDGMVRTLYLRENDSIVQRVTSGNNKSVYYWSLKDTVGGTKITWRARGELGFMDKIDATLQGGAVTIVGNSFEKGLSKIDNNLDYEINSYNVALKGIVQKPAVSYLRQTVNSKIANHHRNMRIMLTRMEDFFDENQIKAAGPPFIVYHTYDITAGTTKFSVCMPVAEEIHITPGSDMSFGRMEGMTAVNTILNGDYSHLQKSWLRANEYIASNKLSRSGAPVAVESFKIGADEIKQPSKWVTEVFIPIEVPIAKDTIVATRATPRPAPRSVRRDSINSVLN